MQLTTIGLDIAKNVFQVHGIDATEKVIVRKQLQRGQIIAFFEALARTCQMIRSTRVQKAERLRAARRLLADEIGIAEAAVALSRTFGFS
jgi:transposase